MKRVNGGFTLVEVMVALVVFAVMASAISIANTQSIAAARQIEEQQNARWLTQNALTELRLSEVLPKPGLSKDKVTLNNNEWTVEIETFNVEVEIIGPFLRRVEVRAYLENDESAVDRLHAVIGHVQVTQ
ncbi:prepilin-type N-terminal cleavage/methylation domain-containing protein [Reinekea marina]|uniref:Prepilin-type N-terminal cleavage/methylation domain-containing protein n=1 Tax=Reinekea marina TaxID=1310421 RepID=A0ABV7WQE9_9GAMM|nr:prepilin-type N-terminal cleavage/methylation domain-containing protein [Reinekea marina]MBU2863288.1 prepilin-type N-terminal cleavage/methylation domain-containing protein [Reinekea forsetii]MDN3649503.1 prepilin-type N-terminal cleavage/methylation domain-containing protein [Reinekea marina]